MSRRLFSLNDRLTFGKYKGNPLSIVIREDPQYIVWCLEALGWFEISDGAERELKYTLDEHHPEEV